MNPKLDLDQLERETWAHQFKDGLFEISFGWLMIWASLLDQDLSFGLPKGVGLVLIFAPLPFLFVAKRYLSEPRIGKVKLALSRSPLRIRSIIYSFVIMIPAFLVFILDKDNAMNWLTVNGHDLTGNFIVWLGLMIAAAIQTQVLKTWRMFCYLVLLCSAMVLKEILLAYPVFVVYALWPPVIAGSIIMLIGIFVFIAFLKKYPKP